MIFGKKKCPKCNGTNINVVKESMIDNMRRSALNVAIPVRFLTSRGKKPRDLNVCQDCSFNWEDRK